MNARPDCIPEKKRRRKNIRNAVRRELATRLGGEFGKITATSCQWCGEPGQIVWTHTPGWVCFTLEIDHLTALAHGGSDEADNLVLACLPCNRSRFYWRTAA